LARQEEAIALLEELVEKEKEAHSQEMRALNASIELFAREKDAQCRKYEETILKLGKKVDHYKVKNCQLNEKVKENADTIKALMEKKLKLEC
jgi:predicted RNase H-like nuclease (RuvC/YqgF family)